MSKPFAKKFLKCCLHFKTEEIIIPVSRENVKVKVRLTNSAFPTDNLPKLRIAPQRLCVNKVKVRYRRLRERNICMEGTVNILITELRYILQAFISFLKAGEASMEIEASTDLIIEEELVNVPSHNSIQYSDQRIVSKTLGVVWNIGSF